MAASQTELSPLVRGPVGSTPSPEPFSYCRHGTAGTWPESWGRLFLSSAFQDGGGGALGQVSQLSLAALCWLVVLAFLSSPHQWKPTFPGSLVFPFGVHRPVSSGPSAGLLVHPRKVWHQQEKQRLSEMQHMQINYSGRPCLTLLGPEPSFSVRNQPGQVQREVLGPGCSWSRSTVADCGRVPACGLGL